jgi:hypothetical protein
MLLMTAIGFRPPTVPAPVTDAAFLLATCPLCHTTDANMTVSVVNAGGNWRCRVCHQNWSARRLETVAAYTEWSRKRDRDRIVQDDNR